MGLGISKLLGLVWDGVGGLVEIGCVMGNGIG